MIRCGSPTEERGKPVGILERIRSAADVKGLTSDELDQLCLEIRKLLISVVSKTGGHLASNCGT